MSDQRLGADVTGVELNPGRMCNNRCVFCMSGYERDEHNPWAEWGLFKDEIRAWYGKGKRAIGFLGGEPTVYPHIVESVAYAKALGYQRIAICTNGMRLADPAFARELVEAGATRFTVSVHSHRPEIEEALVGVPGILEKKIQAIRNLVELRDEGSLPDNVSLNPVFCRLNMDTFEEFLRYFQGLGVDDVRLNFIWPQARVRGDRGVVPRFAEAVPRMLALVAANERGIGMRLSFGGIPFCALPAFVRSRPALVALFDEGGNDVERENAFVHGGTGQVDRFDWLETETGDFKVRPEEICSGCSLRARCQGVYASYLELYGREELGALS